MEGLSHYEGTQPRRGYQGGGTSEVRNSVWQTTEHTVRGRVLSQITMGEVMSQVRELGSMSL